MNRTTRCGLRTALFAVLAAPTLSGGRLPAGRVPEDPFKLQREGSERLHVLEGDSPVLTYVCGMVLKEGVPEDRRRSSYVHPVYAPDGTALTDDFPADHLHHRGLSWMWPNVIVDGARYSLWDIRGAHQRFERWIETSAGPLFARLKVENGWYAGPQKLAREVVDLTIHRRDGRGRAIDVTLEFEVLDRPVRLIGELPDRKGYGGLCFRFAPRQETVLTTPNGIQPEDSDLRPVPWADISGRFDPEGRPAGAAIFVNPSNPGFPNGWTLRHYGFLGVAWPGMEPHELRPGTPLQLRYRVWVHTGKVAGSELGALYRSYADSPRAAAPANAVP